MSMDRPRPQRMVWMPRRAWLAVGALVILAAALVAWFFLSRPATLIAHASDIQVFAASSAPSTRTIRALVQPDALALLSAPITGTVSDIRAADEDLVQAGQLLAHLSNTGLRLEIARTQAQLMSEIGAMERSDTATQLEILDAENAHSQVRLELEDLTVRLGELRPLYERGLYPGRDFQALVLRHSGLEQQASLLAQKIRQLRTQRDDQAGDQAERLERLRESLAISEEMAGRFDLVAPIAGRLSGFDLVEGQVVSEGQALAHIQADDQIFLKAALDQFYLSRVTVGARARMLNGSDGEYIVRRRGVTIEGGLFEIELEPVSRASGVVASVVGESVALELDLAPAVSDRDELISTSAIVADGASLYVYAVSDDLSEVRPIPVTLDVRGDGERRQVLDGLNAGTRYLVHAPDGPPRRYALRVRD